MDEVLEIIQPIKQPSLLYKTVIVPCAEVKKVGMKAIDQLAVGTEFCGIGLVLLVFAGAAT